MSTTAVNTTTMSAAGAKERLLAILPHIRLAVAMAEISCPEGRVELGVLSVLPNGGGRVTAQFEAAAFLDDLSELLGVDATGFPPEPNDDSTETDNADTDTPGDHT